jgi:hypothetical protein
MLIGLGAESFFLVLMVRDGVQIKLKRVEIVRSARVDERCVDEIPLTKSVLCSSAVDNVLKNIVQMKQSVGVCWQFHWSFHLNTVVCQVCHW